LIGLINRSDEPEKTFQEIFANCGVEYPELTDLWDRTVGRDEILLVNFVKFLNVVFSKQKERGFAQDSVDEHARLVVTGIVMNKQSSFLLVQLDSLSYDFMISGKENANVFRKVEEGEKIQFEISVDPRSGLACGRNAQTFAKAAVEVKESSVSSDAELAYQLALEDQKELDRAAKENRGWMHKDIEEKEVWVEDIQEPPTFQCAKCLQMCHHDNVFVSLSSVCRHQVCRGCAKTHIVRMCNDYKFPITCPVAPACQDLMSLDECLNVFDDQEQGELLSHALVYCLEYPEAKKDCIRAGCQGFTIGGNTKECVCPRCKLRWCSDCRTDWHTGITCAQFIASRRENANLSGKSVQIARKS
jgi:hypothetical protein